MLDKVGEKQAQIIMSENPTVATAMADGYMTQDEYNSLTNNEAVQAQGRLVEEKRNAYEKIGLTIKQIEADVNKEFE